MDDIGETSSILRNLNGTHRKLFDVTEFYLMAEAGVFARHPRVELIEGEIIEMAPIGGLHIRAVMALTQIFVLAAAGRFGVSIQSPLRLDDHSEPEPDFVLLRLPVDRTRTNEPPRAADAALVVEVAHTSLQYDTRVKMPLYARYGIPESWLVDVDAASITVYRSPTHDGYEDIKTYQEAERIEPLALPGVLIQVADIVTN